MSSKRQKDYLLGLLSDDAEPAASPAPAEQLASAQPAPTAAPSLGSAMSLLARENVLNRVAAGEVKQVTELALDPKRVRIWQGNPRHQASLTEESCRDLIDAIKSEGGQKVPAIVRRVHGDPDHDYEVIAGTRRHWAISWLRANSYPDMKFIAQVHALDDEAAFRLSDIENRARKDVSDYERACTYARALELHYGGKQARMAERLNVSKGWLSKLLTVAALPDWIVAAFASLADIQLKACYPLAQKIQGLLQARDREAVARFQAVAKRLADEQASRRNDGKPAIGAADVLSQLGKADAPIEVEDALVKFDSASGRTALSVLSSNRNGVSIRLHAGSGASQKDLENMFRDALSALEKQGRGLRC